jgi:hypothetical protein
VEDWLPGVAIASLSLGVSARTAYRQHQLETLPLLHIQPLALPHGVAVAIHNGGKGLAKSTFFYVSVGQDALKQHVGTGFLKPGDEVLVRTTLPVPSDIKGVDGFVWCLDHNNVKRAWSIGGKSMACRSRFLRRKVYPYDDEVFERLCGRSAEGMRLDRYGLRMERPE